PGRGPRLDRRLLLLDDLAAQIHAFVADVNAARTRDEALDLILTLATEGTAVRHACPLHIRHGTTIPSLSGTGAGPSTDPAAHASNAETSGRMLLNSIVGRGWGLMAPRGGNDVDESNAECSRCV